MKIGLAMKQVASSEEELAKELFAVGERHKADHDILHVTKTLAKVESGHLDSLAVHAERYGASLAAPEGEPPGPRGPLQKAVEKSAEMIGRRPEPSLLLLWDLRKLYLLASEASINWVMLAQGAQAVKDAALLETVTACHDQTLRTVKWTTYRIKTASPQTLAT